MTRLRATADADLQPHDLGAWRALRKSLERRAALRTLGRQFRQTPDAYLAPLEFLLIKEALPT